MNSAPNQLLRPLHMAAQHCRGLLKPPRNLPFRGIYRTDGETVRKDELLVCQGLLNYHPGLNVNYVNDRGEKLLKSDCDGVVRISREKIDPDFSRPEMDVYKHKTNANVDIYKLTFNVVPTEMSKTFNLVSEV